MHAKITSLVFAATLSFSSSYADQSHAEQSFLAPLVKKSKLFDIDRTSQSIIVGERGHVLVEGDNSQFYQVQAPTKASLTAVTSLNQKAWAVGHDATIIKSDDAANSWQVVMSKPELDRPFLDVLFFNELEGVAVGAYGLFYRTVDGGASWDEELHASVLPQEDIDYLETLKDDIDFYNEELSFILPHFNRVSLSDDLLLIAGEAGLIATSSDLGKTWQREEIDYFGSFFDVQQIGSTLVAAGLRGNLFVKDLKASQAQWLSIQTCLTSSLNSIVNTDGKVFVTGNNGVVFELITSLLSSDKRYPADSDGCERTVAIKDIPNDISDSVLNASLNNNTLTAVTESGIQSININEE